VTEYPMFISYYTRSHKPLADRMVESLDKFKLPHDMVEIPDENNQQDAETNIIWARACQKRCSFIKEMLNKYDRVVWLDADTLVIKEPILFNQIVDPYMVGLSIRPGGVLGGVIFAQKSSQWFWDLTDTMVLPDEDARTTVAFQKCRNEEIPLHVYPLPIAYQWVPWIHSLEAAIPVKDVVIVHLMAHSKEVHDTEWARWHRGI
jgi:lipopolysaccharide biosynthesis glycosyltransferase